MNGSLPCGEAVEGAAALVGVDLVVVAVDEQRPARHVEEEAERAEQNVLEESDEGLLRVMGCVKLTLILKQFDIRTRIDILEISFLFHLHWNLLEVSLLTTEIH